jgi:uncharacterized protein (TIGR02646 family)
MKYIEKQAPPKSLLEYKSTKNATYDGFTDKEGVRLSLISEQNGLCAYCMSRISNERDETLGKYKTEIEHYKPQHLFEDLQLDYQNMLGVCNGNAGNPLRMLHCDKKKGGDEITIHPLSQTCESFLQYRSDGILFSEHAVIQNDIDKTLNLNIKHLKENRRIIIEIARQRMLKHYPRWTKADLLKEIRFWATPDKKGDLKPFCQAAIAYLNNKVARLP